MKADRYLCLALAMLVTAGCARKSDDVTTPLHQAAAKGDVNQVQALLSQGADVDARDLGGRTPLHVAARDGHKDIVSLLLDNGANINALDKWGYSVLHRARHSGGDSVAELLLARGAYVRTQSQDGETPLHEAARHAWIELVTQLVAKGANVNTAARNGDTPLLRAILGYSEAEYDRYALDPERMKMVRFLIAKGADANAANKAGDTPLNYAARSGDLQLAKLVVDNGAQPSGPSTPDMAPAVLAMNRNHQDVAGLLVARGADVTLHLTAYVGDLEKTRSLLKNGNDVNARDPAGRTPLHMAARGGQRVAAELLIDRGADVNAKAMADWTALHEAVQSRYEDIVELLIARGAAVNVKTTPADGQMIDRYLYRSYTLPGTTPLHLAARYPEIAKVLVAHGADVNAQDQDGITPIRWAVSAASRDAVGLLIAAGAKIGIHDAAYMGFTVKVGELLDSGADANAPDENGNTPLYLAVVGGYTDMVELLATHGANLNERHNHDDEIEDETLLHKAAQFDFEDVAGVLIAHGADVHAKDRSGNTPLHSAAYCGSVHAVQVLLAHGANPNAKTNDDKLPLDYAQEAGFADVAQLFGGNPNDLKRGPYEIVVTDPNAVRRFLKFQGIRHSDVWIPERSDIQGLDNVLRAYLRENIALDFPRDPVLAELRRYNREYSGFISDGRKYILCSMHHGIDEKPLDNRFTIIFDGWYGVLRVFFDCETKTVTQVECNGS